MNYNSDYEVRLATLEAMGGDVTKHYDSVYEIDLEILKLTEQGGGSTSAIEEVSELPDVSENKEKLYRLSSDDNVYVSELKSRTSTTTNRLPDAQQIDKAYIYTGDLPEYYKGDYTITCSDGILNWYLWEDESGLKWATQENAVNSTSTTPIIMIDAESEYWGDVTETSATTTMTMQEVTEYDTIQANGELVVATYNAPESAQIGNAYIYSDAQGGNYEYIGTEVEVSYQGTTISGYKWGNSNTDFLVSTKKASEIYFLLDSDMGGSAYYDFELYSSVDGDVVSDSTSDIYIPQLNAPDSEQVDNAYLEMETHNKGNGKFYYKGEIQIREYNYETVSSDYVIGHLWETEDKYHRYVTLTNAQNIYGGNIGGHFADEDLQYYGDEIGWASTTYTLSEIPSLISYYDTDYIISQVPSTVKYQRTEVTEEWGWQPLTDNATNDDIDLMFASESPVVKRVLMSDYASPLSIKEGLVNVSGETMEYDGQTYYKWVKYEEHNGESVIDDFGYDTELVVLTTSLNPSLPFSDESPEYAYHLVIDGGEGEYWGLDTYPKEALIHEDGSITYEE